MILQSPSIPLCLLTSLVIRAPLDLFALAPPSLESCRSSEACYIRIPKEKCTFTLALLPGSMLAYHLCARLTSPQGHALALTARDGSPVLKGTLDERNGARLETLTLRKDPGRSIDLKVDEGQSFSSLRRSGSQWSFVLRLTHAGPAMTMRAGAGEWIVELGLRRVRGCLEGTAGECCAE